MGAFHDPDFIIRQFVEIIDQPVDLAVGGVDLALEVCFFVICVC